VTSKGTEGEKNYFLMRIAILFSFRCMSDADVIQLVSFMVDWSQCETACDLLRVCADDDDDDYYFFQECKQWSWSGNNNNNGHQISGSSSSVHSAGESDHSLTTSVANKTWNAIVVSVLVRIFYFSNSLMMNG
jgi:hypothetical protein